MDKKWVFLKVDEAKERELLANEDEADKSLLEAIILHPADKTLSGKAIETLRQMRYYTDAERGLVLLGEQECVAVDVNFPEDMIEEAIAEAGDVAGRMPDFEPLTMDDDHGLLCMGEKFFGYRTEGLAVFGGMMPIEALKVRGKCIEVCEDACDTGEVLAVMYPRKQHTEHLLATSKLL